MSDVLIPADYWLGRRNLDLEIPWVTPEAIDMLAYFCKPWHTVMEFGAGGSTLFFARRTKFVLSFEHDQTWGDWTFGTAMKRGIDDKVELHVCPDVAACDRIAGDRTFNIVLVDCDGLDRYDAASMALRRVRKEGVILVDNYSADYCRGLDGLFADIELQTAYDDPHWIGSGTKVYYCR